ncbi:ABC transporter permease [Agromyces lapidis]|uniref:ABC transporter permease n=1 Tax=Agromyces lapidis TaxID=279574 RepID=A0ABV5SRK3_9MICO|nr:ABC transporter permease [Agromyces lapidis]
MRSILRRFRRGTAPDGATADGATADGATADGATRDGAAADGAREGAAIPPIARADRFTNQDLLVEVSHGIGGHTGRLVMTTLGTVLGIASLVVTIGFAQTAAGQISRQFDAVAATQAVLKPGTANSANGDEVATSTLPWDSPARVERLNGVERAGLIGEVPIGELEITAVPINDPSAPEVLSPTLLATSAGLLEAVRGEVSAGRYFDDGHDARADRVAVVGARAAEKLGINRVDSQPSIFIGERPYTVIGIVDGMERRPDLLDSVILPLGTARADFGLRSASELQLRIDAGAGPLVAKQAPIALDPNAPENFDVQAPRAGSELQESVQADINVVFLILGVIALLAGGLGIANVTLLSVSERTGEIGLRRALGATRRQIARQFMVESVVIGLLGGLIGAAVGVFAVVVVALVQQWTPIIDLPMVFGAAILGAVVGLGAGAYPARKASRIEPIAALRAGV